jgi:CRISPR-associated endonuclease/helicase Cas3
MNMKEFYARTIFSKELNPVFMSFQLLDDHLNNVASLAKKFGEKIHVADWCYLAGIWHDLGKYHSSFQAMLKSVAKGGTKSHVDHSSAGAVHSRKCFAPVLKRQKTTERLIYILNILTASIAGHHAGLPAGQLELDNRIRDKESLYHEVPNLAWIETEEPT